MPATPSQPEAFLKKYNHILTYTGAFIVFLTFIVKEGLGEHWRQVAESIDKAQSSYSIRAEIGQNVLLSSDILQHLMQKAHGSSDHQESQLLDWMLLDVEGSASNVGTLLNSLPESKGDQKELFEIKTQLAHGKESMAAFFSPLPSTGSTSWKYVSKYSPKARPPFSDSRDGRELQLFASAIDLRSDAHELTKRVLEVAEGVRQTNEQRSRYAWWISAGLFALGWGLGLLGKLYGVPGVEAEGS